MTTSGEGTLNTTPEKQNEETMLTEYDRRFLAAIEVRLPTVEDQLRLLMECKW